MLAPRQIPTATRLRPAFPIWVKALVASCALLLQLVLPVGSHPANAGEWMVICGSEGPALVQVQLADEDQETCPMCDSCQMCGEFNSTNALLSGTGVPADLSHSSNKTVICNDVVGANPAQFWPASRGPPLAQVFTVGLFSQRPNAATPNKGGASWT